ncbi:hypothetical protein AQUCO_01600286v1 [Aquilegia coerulea]|uniref:RING-type domain-containing protein n=1 Tax=Aquilegia coerulea TaxID=218851 RepID=A0A2G5DQY7_AQUCA|nr:hypothetical protein AQUCO_01600286v1 [Aquilegia coerulea]
MSLKREEELLECPICWESFNVVENVPYIFWCGHTLCKTCVLSLRWAEVKLPTLPIQLPLFVSCPWCQLLSFRLVWKGSIRFPKKNFLLLWLVESANGNRTRGCPSSSFGNSESFQPPIIPAVCKSTSVASSREHLCEPLQSITISRQGVHHPVGGWRVCAPLRKSVALLLHLTAKFPVVVTFMLIVMYVIPASAAILVVYLLITFLFALPSFMVLYFSYPILEWLVGEMIA